MSTESKKPFLSLLFELPNTPANLLLLKATQTGNLEVMTRLLEENLSLLGNFTPDEHKQLLGLALLTKNSDAFLLLLHHGADPKTSISNMLKGQNRSLPELIALFSCWKIADKQRALIALAKKNIQLPLGMMKIFAGDPPEKTDIMTTDSHGTTVLHYLAANGLSAAMPNSNIPNDAVRATVTFSSPLTHLRTTQHLLTEIALDVDITDNAGWTPLMFAAISGNLETAKCLLASKADVKADNEHKSTALNLAAANGQLEIVQFLMMKRADTAAQDLNGSTALISAAAGGHTATVQYLLKKRAVGTITALIQATQQGHLATVQCLLAAKIDIGMKLEDDMTLLMLGAHAGHLNVVQYLVEQRANIAMKNKMDGCTAFHIAIVKKQQPIVEYFLTRQISTEVKNQQGCTPLIFAALAANLPALECLLRKKANIEASSKEGFTSLSGAASKGHLSIVRHLLQAKANMEARNIDKQTALLIAANRGYSEVVELLLANKANPEAEDVQQNTALMLAASCGHLRTVQTLVAEKVNIEAKNKRGKTASECALAYGHTTTVQYLTSAMETNTVKNTDVTSSLPSVAANSAVMMFHVVNHPKTTCPSPKNNTTTEEEEALKILPPEPESESADQTDQLEEIMSVDY